MLQALFVGMMVIVGLVVLAVGVVVLPFLLVGLVLKVLFFAILLPLRLLGFLFAGFFAVGAILFKVLLGLMALVFGIVVFAGGVVALPLLPILLAIGFVWLLARLFRPRTVVTRVAT